MMVDVSGIWKVRQSGRLYYVEGDAQSESNRSPSIGEPVGLPDPVKIVPVDGGPLELADTLYSVIPNRDFKLRVYHTYSGGSLAVVYMVDHEKPHIVDTTTMGVKIQHYT